MGGFTLNGLLDKPCSQLSPLLSTTIAVAVAVAIAVAIAIAVAVAVAMRVLKEEGSNTGCRVMRSVPLVTAVFAFALLQRNSLSSG